jgi:hypothetical protein
MILLVDFEVTRLAISVPAHRRFDFHRVTVRSSGIVPATPIELETVPFGGLSLDERPVVIRAMASIFDSRKS